jgi:hypothetical protein
MGGSGDRWGWDEIAMTKEKAQRLRRRRHVPELVDLQISGTDLDDVLEEHEHPGDVLPVGAPREMSRAAAVRAVAAIREHMELHPAVPPPQTLAHGGRSDE